MRFCALILSLILAVSAAQAGDLKIVGDTKYKPHTLVRLKAEGVAPGVPSVWTVTPAESVQRASNPMPNVLEFVADPGEYEVKLQAVTVSDKGFAIEDAVIKVTLQGCQPEVAPQPKPKEPEILARPALAISRIRFGNAGCTAAPIHPRRADGRWDILTAAHCISAVGQRGQIQLQDGRVFAVLVTALNKANDIAWLCTEESIEDMPFAILAKSNPAVGTTVWHAGYGFDRPGNREDGVVQSRQSPSGQLQFLLNVSSGDSGGPILRADNNEVVASVCCTTRIAGKAPMFGGSCEQAWLMRPKLTAENVMDLWAPVEMQIVDDQGRKVVNKQKFDWKPSQMRLVEITAEGVVKHIETDEHSKK